MLLTSDRLHTYGLNLDDETLEKLESLHKSSSDVKRSRPLSRDVVVDNNVTELCATGGGCCKKDPVKLKQCHLSGGKRIKITCPGCYEFAENLVYSPVADPGVQQGLGAIEICASDVVLNLNCHTLSQGNDIGNVVGILVFAESRNVTIDGGNGGAVYNFSQIGIRVKGRTSEITLKNLLLKDNGLTRSVEPYLGDFDGVLVDSYASGYVTGGFAIGDSMRTTGFGDVYYVDNIDDVLINDFRNPEYIVRNVVIENVHAIHNYSYGGGIYNADTVIIKDSLFNENIRETTVYPNPAFPGDPVFAFFNDRTSAVGLGCEIVVFSSNGDLTDLGLRNLTVENSQFNKNINQKYNAGTNSVEGILGTLQLATFDNCTFNDNQTTDGAGSFPASGSSGLSILNGQNLTFRNCSFDRNVTTVPADVNKPIVNTPGFGYLPGNLGALQFFGRGGLPYATQRNEACIIETCSFSNNELRYNKSDLPASLASAARGIFWEGGYGVVFKDCVVAGNKVLSERQTKLSFTGADANMANDGKYFHIDSANVKYYVWLDYTGTTSDPGPFAGRTGLRARVDLQLVPNKVAKAVEAVLLSTGNFIVSRAGDVVTVINITNDGNSTTSAVNINVVNLSISFTAPTTMSGAGSFPLRCMEIIENSTSAASNLDSYVFENCKVLNNTILSPILTDNTTAGIYTGRRFAQIVTLANRATNLVLKNCVVSKTGSSTFGSGYNVSGADTVEVVGCVASDHPESGFKFEDVNNLIVKDNISNKNSIGLSFDDTPSANIKENCFSNNVSKGLTIASSTSSSLNSNVMKNQSYNNNGHLNSLTFGEKEATSLNFTGANTPATNLNPNNGKYFFINSANDANQYYVWLDYGGAVDPGPIVPIVGRVGLKADVVAQFGLPNPVARAVAIALTSIVPQKFIVSRAGDTLTVTNVSVGPTTNATQETVINLVIGYLHQGTTASPLAQVATGTVATFPSLVGKELWNVSIIN